MIDSFEIDRPNVCYFYETLQHLDTKFPHTAFSFLVGADWADKLKRWRRWDIIEKIATPIVMTRPGYLVNTNVDVIEVPELPVSGTQLREKLSLGFYDDPLVTKFIYPKALEFIRNHKIYEHATTTPIS